MSEANKSSDTQYKMSASCGFAQYNPDELITIDELIEIADKKMYKNKKEYKKRFRLSEEGAN